ncbi:mesogenin-1 [Silurus meridionalis]|nr:mesogenin-1 [Silurus meridionalis]
MDGTEVDHLTAKLLAQWDWRSDTRLYGQQCGSIAGGCPTHDPSASPCSTCSSSSSSSPSSSSSQEAPGEMFSDYPYDRRRAAQSQTKTSRPKMSTKRRVKASEREKMRMRSLAEALHQLRDYLPPGYSRRGQPLTKIQTLKFTIEYIKELSEILSRE